MTDEDRYCAKETASEEAARMSVELKWHECHQCGRKCMPQDMRYLPSHRGMVCGLCAVWVSAKVPEWVKREAFLALRNAVADFASGMVCLHRVARDEFDGVFWADYLVSSEQTDKLSGLEWAIRIANGGG